MATARDRVITEILAETRDSIGGIKEMIASVVKLTAAYASVRKVAEEAFESAQLAAALNEQRTAFDNLTSSVGVNADSILAEMQRMSGGVITEVELMRNATQANLLGVGFEEMPKLLEIARASARATGQDMQFLFQSITTGIGRMSPLILDNLGLSIRLEETYAAYAASLDKTAAELTDAERKQALLNAVLAQGEEIIARVQLDVEELTDTERWAALTTAVTEFRTELGQGLRQTFADAAGAFTGFINLVTGAMRSRRLVEELTGMSREEMRQLSPARIGEFLAAIEFSVEQAQERTINLAGGAGSERIQNRIRDLRQMAMDLRTVLADVTRMGGLPAALGGGRGGGDTAPQALTDTVQEVGVLTASLGEIEQIMNSMRLQGGDIGLGQALGLMDPNVVPRMEKAADAFKDINDALGEGIFRGVMGTFVDGMTILGESLAMGADGAERTAEALRQMFANFLSNLSGLLLEAGLRTIIANPYDPRGWALVIASGLVAIIGGAAGAPSGSDIAPGGAATASALSRGPVQPQGSIIINNNNVNVHGSVLSERQLAATIARQQ